MNMNYHTLKIGTIFFNIMPDETVLECACRNGIKMKYHCTSGYCGTCKTKLICGSVSMDHSGGISRKDIDDGYILTCCSFAHSDLEI